MNKDYFSYYDGKDQTGDNFRISPSQLSKFFDSTVQWWREQVLKEDAAFQGSTASELGNCVHAAANMFFEEQQVYTQAIEDYITSIDNADVDKSEIRSQWKTMVTELVHRFLSTGPGTEAEIFVHAEVAPGVLAAGSIDLYDERTATVYDYKTMGSLDTARVPTTFPRAYWFQQLTYAWILRKQGKPCDWIKLVYVSRNNTGRISEKTGKPMKDYPTEVNILPLQVTDENMEIIESVLKLVAESYLLYKDKPELLYILAQDYRLKDTKVAPVLFK